jgi:capsular polysaccharide transport system permease protein
VSEPPKQATAQATTPQLAIPDAPEAQVPQASVDDQISAIQKEGLTGSQLRMSRRVANEHELPVNSDINTVRLLRSKGINPFHRSNPLDWIAPGQNENASPAKPKDKPETKFNCPSDTALDRSKSD